MAQDIREVLSKYVPAAVLDEAVEAVSETEIAPEWFRTEAAKLGADAKEAASLRTELESIRSEPKRLEAYKRVGLLPQDAADANALKPYQKDWLDSNIPADKLDDLEFVAGKVSEGGFEITRQSEETREKTGAERIADFTSTAGEGAPVARSKDDDFYRDLEAIPDGDKEATRAVLAKHGRLQSEG